MASAHVCVAVAVARFCQLAGVKDAHNCLLDRWRDIQAVETYAADEFLAVERTARQIMMGTSNFDFSLCRLRKRKEFDQVMRNAQTVRLTAAAVTVYACPNSYQHPRLGITVSRRVAGNAVSRNRIKRLIRISFMSSHWILPPVDTVVVCRHGGGTLASAEWFHVLELMWQNIAQKISPLHNCAHSWNGLTHG